MDGNASPAINDYEGIPVYCLTIVATSPVVDRGDEFDIKLYISGAGEVDFGQISTTIPPEIVECNRIVYTNVDMTKTPAGYREHIYDKTRFQSRLDPRFYQRIFFKNTSSALPILIGEADYDDRPPFRINFTIADDAPAGDHTITINHYYKHSGKWFSDKNELKLHVNYWYEEGRLGHPHLSFQSMAIVTTVLAVLLNNFLDLVNWLVNSTVLAVLLNNFLDLVNWLVNSIF